MLNNHNKKEKNMIVDPLGDNIVVREFVKESQTALGIHLVGDYDPNSEANRGEVIAVGPGRILQDGREIPLTVAPGDVVVYGNLTGSRIQVAGEEYIVLSERGVLAIEDSVHPPEPDVFAQAA